MCVRVREREREREIEMNKMCVCLLEIKWEKEDKDKCYLLSFSSIFKIFFKFSNSRLADKEGNGMVDEKEFIEIMNKEM